VIGGVLVEGTWQFLLNPALIFLPYYTADAEPVPPAGANKTALPRQLASGITDTGIVIGYTHELMGDVASASAVTPPTNVFSMSGTATVSTLTNPPTTYNRSATRIWIRPTGEWKTDTAGNIGVAFRARVGRVMELVWDTDTAKWWPVGLDDVAMPLLYSSVSTSGAIAGTTAEIPFSKTYTLPANTLSVPGTVVRVRASGVYSAGDAPSLEIRTKLGPHVVCAAEQTAATGAKGYSWMATCELVARTAGASAVVRGAGGILGLGSTNVVAGGYTSEVYVDTKAAQPVSVTAEWGAANAGNMITLESLTVEVLYPGTTD